MRPWSSILVSCALGLLSAGCVADVPGGAASYDSIGHLDGPFAPTSIDRGSDGDSLLAADADPGVPGLAEPEASGVREAGHSTSPSCGDGHVQAGEQCDDGNGSNGDLCRVDCMWNRCGDGWVLEGLEACDDASETDAGACVDCQPAFCGDGHVQVGVEACDDGVNDGSYGGCSPGCEAGPVGCADGSVEQHFGPSMRGCAGRLPFADRGYACEPGWHVCSAAEWVHRADPQAPALHYWTDDVLPWGGLTGRSGASAQCVVERVAFAGISGVVVEACPGQAPSVAEHSPLRVCALSGEDALGNECEVAGCALESFATSRDFGGCGEVATAGTLCCR